MHPQKVTRVSLTWIVGIPALVYLVYLGFDTYRAQPKSIHCEDGQRSTIDLRQFETRYTGNSIHLEANLNNRATLAAKIDPVQLQNLSASVQEANEFRKFLIAGFNACGISKLEFSQMEQRYEALDSLAHELDTLSAKPHLTAPEQANFSKLTDTYIRTAHDLRSGNSTK